VATYVPERGDLVWLVSGARANHERTSRYPVLVLSPRAYNAKVGLILACPVAHKSKGYPFEVALPEGLPVSGVILADQVSSLDWRQKQAAMIAGVPPEVLAETLAKTAVLLQG